MRKIYYIFFLTVLFSLFAGANLYAQVQISGTVTSAEDGQGLPGAAVMVKGTTTGTMTDMDGNYSLTAPSKESVLVISFMGYTTQEITVGEQTSIGVKLASESKSIDDVVVVGYGVMKKSDLTGSVTSLKSADLANVKAANPLQALQGKAAGLDLTQSSGQAGAGVNITLRGNRSITANNNPLILVDGVEYGSTLDLNASDIESIEVLKDAASTAIYGTRGANGVIMVTTKKGGKGGKTNVTFSSFVSFNTPNYIPKVQSSQQYLQKRYEILVADDENAKYADYGVKYDAATKLATWSTTKYADLSQGTSMFGKTTLEGLTTAAGKTNPAELITGNLKTLDLISSGADLDYLDMIMVNSVSQNYELGVTGGDEKTSFNLSFGYMNDKGLLRNDEMKKYNFKLGVNHKMWKVVNVGANILYTYKKYEKRNSGIFNQAMKTTHIGELYDADGKYKIYPDEDFSYNQPNPMLDETSGASIDEIFNHRIFSSAFASANFLKYFTFKSNLGLDLQFNKEGTYYSATSLKQIAAGKVPAAGISNTSNYSYTWDNTLNFNRTLGMHDIQVLVGASRQASNEQTYSSNGLNQSTGATEYYYWDGFASTTSSSKYIDSKMISVFGRVNYKLNEKYLFQATYRADASSVLAPSERWSYFPSTSIGWRINQESFLKDVKAISNLKLRLSWGKAGNAAVRPYQSMSVLGKYPVYSTLDGVVFSSYVPGQSGNKNLHWEMTGTTDLGLDFGFFNGRVSGSVDVYKSKTTDLLFPVNLPATSIFTVVTQNIAESKGKGIEIQLNTVNMKKGGFEWSTDWTFASTKDEITKLRGVASDSLGVQSSEDANVWYHLGDPVKTYYYYERLGIYSVADLQAELDYIQAHQGEAIDRGKIPMVANGFYPGDIKLKDVNGDGYFTDADKKSYNQTPKFTFSINNNFSYTAKFGTIGLSLAIMGRVGQYIDYGYNGAYKSAGTVNENGIYVDAWTPSNTGAEFPRYSTKGNAVINNYYADSYRYVEASFVKIKDITLSYTLPVSVAKKAKLSNVRAFVSAKNYFTFGKIDNFDPEIGGSMNFPMAKQIICGVNISF